LNLLVPVDLVGLWNVPVEGAGMEKASVKEKQKGH
jgi:hypothetical protein